MHIIKSGRSHRGPVELEFGLYARQRADGVTLVGVETDQVGVEKDRVVLEGYGSVLGTGLKARSSIPSDGYIEEIRLFGDPSGSATVDIYRGAYDDLPLGSGNSIFPGTLPALASTIKYRDDVLTGVDRNIDAGDVFEWWSSAVTTIKQVTGEMLWSRRVGPVEPILPTDVPDLALWTDPKQLGAANNAAIGSWTDYSGNNNHVIQATAGKKFLAKTGAGAGGGTVLESDGVDDIMETTNGLGSTGTLGRTIISVTKKIGAVTVSGGDSYWYMGGHDSRMYENAGNIVKFYATGGLNSVAFAGSSAAWAARVVRVRSATSMQFSVNATTNPTIYDPYDEAKLLGNYKMAFGKIPDEGSGEYWPIGAQFGEQIVVNRRISNRQLAGLVAGLVQREGFAP